MKVNVYEIAVSLSMLRNITLLFWWCINYADRNIE